MTNYTKKRTTFVVHVEVRINKTDAKPFVMKDVVVTTTDWRTAINKALRMYQIMFPDAYEYSARRADGE